MKRLSCFSKNGKHKNNELEEVYSFHLGTVGNTDAVIKWCRVCGAIVIDRDYDGRISPGAIVPLQFPDYIKELS